MKALTTFGVILLAAFASCAEVTNSLERFSLQFTTNTPIVWQAPTDRLPKSFRIYKRLAQRPFLASAISNAVILASLQDKGFPKPSTNAFYVWGPSQPGGMSFSIFSIEPASTKISFGSPDQSFLTNNIPDEETVTRHAFEYAARFGLDRAHLIKTAVYTTTSASGHDETLTKGVCGRGIVLTRNLGGVGFFNYGNGDNMEEGFSIEFGSKGQIRSFVLVWPNLERDQEGATAGPQEIVRSIREHKVMVLPDEDESNYFGRLKTLAAAKSLTITKITPYYGEGAFGETPANDEPAQTIAPFVELEAVADLGSTKMPVRLLTPILASESVRTAQP